MQTNDTPPLADRVTTLELQVAELQQELTRRRAGDRYRRELENLWAAHEEHVGAKMDEVEGRLTVRIDRLQVRVDVLEDNLTRKIDELRGEVKSGQAEILAMLKRQFGSNGH
jgi:hypothetical protein